MNRTNEIQVGLNLRSSGSHKQSKQLATSKVVMLVRVVVVVMRVMYA